MKTPPLKAWLFGAAVFCLISLTSCTYDPYGVAYGSSYGSYTYTNYPYGYTTAHLPYGYSSVYLGGTRYWHCNNHYYRHYPGRGYVVVKRPHGHSSHHGNSHYSKPTKYTHYKGNRYIYQNRPNHSHRGSGPQAVPSGRSGSVNHPSRYNTVRTSPSGPRTVRTHPVSVQPTRGRGPSGSTQVRSRPTSQPSATPSAPPSGGTTIRRNPSNSHRGYSPGAAPRSAPTRSAASRGSGARRKSS